MEDWKNQIVSWNEKGELYYFLRGMKRNNACKRMYYAHIFICSIENEQQLVSQWRDVNSRVAVYIQSNVESIIERTNFYICFFVEQEISLDVQSQIENDTFCAKKYIFHGNKMNLEDKCFEVEKKIFSIEIDSNGENITKLKEIQLQNFRAYKSRNQIKLSDSNENPASFVAIYAKNGVGKTSIFDGIEFALKGEISRFKAIEDKEFGAIYHNRENADKVAYVDLILENNKEIKRKVASIRNGKNDIRKNQPVVGKELVGEAEQWEQTILPHDKIDNFISAKSGVERYKEWIESTGLEAKYNIAFVDAYSNLINVNKEINRINEEITKNKKLLETLRQQTDKVKLWKELINQYNQNNEERKIKFEKEFLDEKVYDYTINTSSQYIREYKVLLGNLNDKIRIAETILNKKVIYYINSIKRIPEHQKEILKIEKKIEQRKKYDVLQKKIEQSVTEIEKINKDLLPIIGILKYGVEDVITEKKQFITRSQEIENQNNLMKFRVSEKTELNQKIEAIGKEIKLKEVKINQEKEKNELRILRNELENCGKNREKLKEKLEGVLTNETKVNQIIENIVFFLKQIKEKCIPETINELHIEKLSGLEDFFDTEILKKLQNIQKRYENTLRSIRLCQEKVKKIEQDQKELEKLLNQGREYINQHQDICECPLCHTDFFEWGKLFQSVNVVQENGQKIVQNEIRGLSEELININQEYGIVFKEYNHYKNQIEEKKSHYIKKYEKDKQEIEKNKHDILIQDNILIKKESEIRCKLIQENIELVGTVDNAMKIWFEAQHEQLKELQVKKDKYYKRKDELEKEDTRINNVKKNQEKVIKNTILYNHILFLMEKPLEYNAQNELSYLIKSKDKLNEQKNQDESLVVKLNIHKEETVLFLNQKLVDEQSLLDSDMKVKKECNIFNQLSEENIKECLEKWKNEREKKNESIELLNKISEENGVREYFRDYRRIEINISKQSELRESKEKVKKQNEILFNESKTRLQEKLEEYFSETIISEIFRKIDPHQVMKNIEYELDFNEKGKPELYIKVSASDEANNKDSYRPEWFFSSAQLNMVAFSSFFSRALQAKELSLGTIFIDDPIGHFDDINILGFADLLRSVLEAYDCQIVIATHDDKVFSILERKLSSEYYNSRFIRLPEDCIVLEESK